MLSTMMDVPLLISSLIEHAGKNHASQEIVTRTDEGSSIHRYTFADLRRRSRLLAIAIEQRLGIKLGDRVASLAFNTFRHLEMFYGISGTGAILHTINPRLFPEQIRFIADHGGATVLFVDMACWHLVDDLVKAKSFAAIVIMADRPDMPQTDLDVICYEDLLAGLDDEGFEWPEFDERTGSVLCYTSGTTGDPKGVLYSHRGTVLCSLSTAMGDGLLGPPLDDGDVVLITSPMFHACAWMLPYRMCILGTKTVLPGRNYEAASLYELIEAEQVTATAAVPTIISDLVGYLQASGKRLSSLRRINMGGAAVRRSLIETLEQTFDLQVYQSWGMTETTAIGTKGTLPPGAAGLSFDERVSRKCFQGRSIFGVEMKIVDADENELPRDGEATGNLLVRGPWITGGYYRGDTRETLDNGRWLRTGDVAKLRPDGYLILTDRSKDVIKSGGEWISSVDLENAAASHPAVREAGVIGVFHPRWDERPLLIAVRQPGMVVDADELRAWLIERVARWWVPENIVFADDLPRTATGKLSKIALRQQLADGRFGLELQSVSARPTGEASHDPIN